MPNFSNNEVRLGLGLVVAILVAIGSPLFQLGGFHSAVEDLDRRVVTLEQSRAASDVSVADRLARLEERTGRIESLLLQALQTERPY